MPGARYTSTSFINSHASSSARPAASSLIHPDRQSLVAGSSSSHVSDTRRNTRRNTRPSNFLTGASSSSRAFATSSRSFKSKRYPGDPDFDPPSHLSLKDRIEPQSSSSSKRPHSPDSEDPNKSRRTTLDGSPLDASVNMGPPRGRGRNNNARKTPGLPILPGPLHDRQWIMSEYGQSVVIKQMWQENPKAPLFNYLGGGTGGAQNLEGEGKGFQLQEGSVDGRKVCRISVDAGDGITGVGDAQTRKEAEKLASLSAVLQLAAGGFFDQPKKPAVAADSAGAGLSAAPAAAATAKLSDGTEVVYDRARQFMEWYCRRYNFSKPEIEYSSVSVRNPAPSKKKGGGGGLTSWEAIMSVGGRRIGMGQAKSKKDAQIRCYLDVTQYLESVDRVLWEEFAEFSKKNPQGDIGHAPHLLFQMSESLNEDLQGLCKDIRSSLLYYNAPPPNAATVVQSLPAWSGGRRSYASQTELEEKSIALQEKLMNYETDPKLEKMRATRHALPVFSKASDILARIEVNDVTIIMAATGSGKTTQVPQLLFDDFINRGQGAHCNIVCTQPRRLAAMSVAERVADERGDVLGREVGYQVRFDQRPPQPNGSITFCTTGIFLKRMQSSLGAKANADSVSAMDQVTHIVVDEVHERDIDTDLLLVVLKRLLADRKARKKPLKIILMSATIDPTLFQRYFADEHGRPAPVADIPGRTFPVQRNYLDDFLPALRQAPQSGWVFQDKKVAEYLMKEMSPDPATFTQDAGSELDIPFPLVALSIAHVLQHSDDGHVLVFLPGWEEIKKVANILLDGGRQFPLLGLRLDDQSKYSIHYLHSTIPAAEQREVFKPPPAGVRRIILATNIAETSVTIPDVVYVVDAGRVKEKRYDPSRHMSSLVSAWVGASNLGQRAGRAGRHREGEYYGLLSKLRLQSLDPHQTVEMKRSDLSNVVMHVKALNLGEVEEVLESTIEPPQPERVTAALESLHMLGALDSNKSLTPLGRVLLQLPVDAAIGKLCLYGSFFRCLDSALTLAAVLTNRDPFLAPIALKQQADAIKDSWSPHAFRSDPLAIVAAYNQWSGMDDRGDYHGANRFCSDNFLSKPSLLQIKKVKGHLLQSLDHAGVIRVSTGDRQVGRITHRGEVPMALRENDNSLPLLAALIAVASAPNFAIRTSEKSCRTSHDKMVLIHNSSVNARRRETGGPALPSDSFHPGEKRLYAFGEKSRNPTPGNPNAGITQLRSVTRLDPMTYMVFGAYELLVTQRGLECDGWLPVAGNLHALDDVQRLKTLLDACLLRVFEGVGKALTLERDTRSANRNSAVEVHSGTSRIQQDSDDLDESKENESEDEEETPGATGIAKFQNELAQRNVRKIEPLAIDEIRELEMLTNDIVRILDAYSHEREGTGSSYSSRPATPSNVYRPPPARGNTSRW